MTSEKNKKILPNWNLKMNEVDTEEERVKFEKRFLLKPEDKPFFEFSNGCYRNMTTNLMWLGWRSRAELERSLKNDTQV